MNESPGVLTATRVLLKVVTGLNAVYALALAALLVATFVIPDLLFKALVGLEGGEHPQVHAALRGIVVLGIAGALVVHRVLRELKAIVDTVRLGDPFLLANARHLRNIAWWVLAGEGVRLAVAGLVWTASRHVPAIGRIDVGFSVAPWLAVLLLFVLARVFDQGARMRAELEGTV
jgi:hypothetical protein